MEKCLIRSTKKTFLRRRKTLRYLAFVILLQKIIKASQSFRNWTKKNMQNRFYKRSWDDFRIADPGRVDQDTSLEKKESGSEYNIEGKGRFRSRDPVDLCRQISLNHILLSEPNLNLKISQIKAKIKSRDRRIIQ